MKDHKRQLLDVALFDYQYIQRHLTGMAAKGWRLEKISSFGLWHYRRSYPAEVRYEVTYAPSASAYNSRPTEDEEALTDLCAEAGWERVATLAQMHVYCNEDPNATPLETDELTRIATLRRAMNRHFVPQYLLVAVLFAVQFAMQLYNVIRWPVSTLSSNLMVGNLILMPTIVLSYLALIGGYLLWVRRAENAAENGLTVPECVFYRRFRWVLWLVVVGYIALLLLSCGMGILGAVLIYATVALGLTGVTMNITKSMGAPKWVNIAVPFVVCFLGIMLLTPLIFGIVGSTLPDPNQNAEDPLPLTLTQLTGETDTNDLVIEQGSSFLLTYTYYFDSGEEESISCTLADVHCPLFYDLILNEQEQDYLNPSFYNGDEIRSAELRETFGAEYARRTIGSDFDRLFICWEDRILFLHATWPMTDEQIATTAELLKP